MGESRLSVEDAFGKTYRKTLWEPFLKAIAEYRLLEPGDKVLAAVSGGKDSLLMAKMLLALKRHAAYDIETVCLTMDPGYEASARRRLLENAQKAGIDLTVETHNVFKIASDVSKDSPCFLCARMRRGYLYAAAERHGCNKLALGHHFDDVIETTMLNICYAGTFKTMLPKVNTVEAGDVELIRPMYFIREKAIFEAMSACDIESMDCACGIAAGALPSKRREMKKVIADLSLAHPGVDRSIFRASANVNLDHVTGWVKDGKRVRFDE